MRPGENSIELLIQDINRRLENLKVQFNLFFTGEIRIPPEKDRAEMEIRIRNMMSTGQKSPRLNFLLQNLSSRFSLYNNMWLKRLNEIETGIPTFRRKKTTYLEEPKPPPPPPPPPRPKGKTIPVSLNREDSFDKFFDNYSRMLSPKAQTAINKDQLINSLKSKLITGNLVDAKVNLTLEKGKLRIIVKPVQQHPKNKS